MSLLIVSTDFQLDDEIFRSGLEREVAEQIVEAGHPLLFEKYKLSYVQPEKHRGYTPDFVLLNGIVIEVKGQFDTASREKMKLVRASHPQLDIRFIFGRAKQRISKKSKTTYAQWCIAHGFPYSDHGVLPLSWLEEPRNDEAWEAARELIWKAKLQ